MAIDTKEKRRMAMDFGKWCGTGMPVPTGMTSMSERAHILNIYFEVLLVPPSFFWRNRNFVGGNWDSRAVPSSSWKSKTVPSTSWKPKVTPPDGSTQVIE